MSRTAITRTISDKHRITLDLAHDICDTMLREIATSTATTGRCSLRDFGTFRLQVRPARTAHNPSTKEKISVPSRGSVLFKASDALRDEMTRSVVDAEKRRGGRRKTTKPKATATVDNTKKVAKALPASRVPVQKVKPKKAAFRAEIATTKRLSRATSK